MFSTQEIGNRLIVSRARKKSFDRELFPQRQSSLSIVKLHFFQNRLVVRRIRYDRDRSIILARAPQHRRPANIDLLDRLFQRHVRLGHRVLERIEVNHCKIDWFNLVSCRLPSVIWIVSEKQQSAVYLRVESFDSSAQNLREAREL